LPGGDNRAGGAMRIFKPVNYPAEINAFSTLNAKKA
jgi:hypothetical protein